MSRVKETVNETTVSVNKRTEYEISVLPVRTNKCSSIEEALNEISMMQPVYVLKTVTVETLTGDELWKKKN